MLLDESHVRKYSLDWLVKFIAVSLHCQGREKRAAIRSTKNPRQSTLAIARLSRLSLSTWDFGLALVSLLWCILAWLSILKVKLFNYRNHVSYSCGHVSSKGNDVFTII